MTLDDDICYRAVERRDPRFDGVFFTAVRTTGIYCRPICPAQTPRKGNCTFVPSAAAAEQAGYRACRRCRPESAPGSPAWTGTDAVVTRALRLIGGGALDRGSVEDLAARLGVGTRHLRRLFQDRLGAGPKAIAQTQRLHLARQLVAGTDMPMTEVALAAGFASLRRFNDAFTQAFRQPPSALRKNSPAVVGENNGLANGNGRTENGPGMGTRIRLPLATRLPYDAAFILGFLRARTITGVESALEILTGGSGADPVYRRTLATPDGPAVVSVEWPEDASKLMVTVHAQEAAGVRPALNALRRIFDLDADSAAIDEALSADPALAPHVARRPGIRVPGGADAFEFVVRAVVGQQISVKGARTILGRIAARAGPVLPAGLQTGGLERLFPGPEDVLHADLEGLGLTTRRQATLKAAAQAFAGRGPMLQSGLPDLLALPGIGPWTAQYVAMRALGEPDALPEGDLGLVKGLGLIGDGREGGGQGGTTSAASKNLSRHAERWRPWRAYAAMRLWALLEEAQP